MNTLMNLQHRCKTVIKSVLVSDETKAIRIKAGHAKGIVMLLNRRHALQIEFGLYESELQPVYSRHINSDSIVYDVGAASGDTTLMFAKLASRGVVYAFEPNKESVENLRKNMQLNPGIERRVNIFESFVGNNGDCVSLDHLVELGQIQMPTFVKIDVDGFEIEVLESATNILKNQGIVVLVETHSIKLEEESLLLLESLGYTTTIIPNARWRKFYPEYRPIEHNRWLVAIKSPQ